MEVTVHALLLLVCCARALQLRLEARLVQEGLGIALHLLRHLPRSPLLFISHLLLGCLLAGLLLLVRCRK